MTMYTTINAIKAFWTASIRRQLMLGIALVHAVLMTIFIVDLVERQRGFLHEQGITTTVSLSETLAANSTSWVLSNDVIGLEEVVQSQAKYPGVQYAMVLNPQGRVLGHTDSSHIGSYVADETSLRLVSSGHERQMLVDINNLVDVAEPIVANGKHIGWARVGINRTAVNANLDIVTRDGILYTLLAIGVGTAFAFFMGQGLTSGLQHIVAVTEQLRAGRRDQRADLDRDDELGALARTFNAMADKIQAREQELEQTHTDLESTVRERTSELRVEISDRKKIEEALKETEAKTRQIVNSAVDGIITTDHKGNILSFNTAAEKIFGYSVFEAAGKNIKILMPSNIAERHDSYMDAYLETGGAKVIGMGRELVAKRKDGSTFLADFSINDFHHAGSTTFVGIIRDITERKEEQYRLQAAMQQLQDTQSDLVQAEKMASLGGLVAGISHEINTPIGVGVTATSHLKERADEMAQALADGTLRKSQLAEFVGTAQNSTGIIQANLNRASDLVRSFKQVAVDQTSDEIRQINLLDYVDEVLESLKPNLRRTKHEITVKGDRGIVFETHPGALSQVITNLVMNSVIHAYDEDEIGHIQITAEKNDGSLTLLYVDDGKGMEDDVSAKIFEPFFTTKRGSGGSGLGMHILFNQVTQTLGGNIQLHSKPGRGTAFDITIPYKTDDLQKGEHS